MVYVTGILSSLWFENLSATYQKGNPHYDPINPLTALLFFFFFAFHSRVSLYTSSWDFSRPDSVAVRMMDGMLFFSVILPCLFMFRGQKKASCWNAREEKDLRWRLCRPANENQMAWADCVGCLTGLCSLVQVKEEDLRQWVKDQRTDS